MQKIKSCIIGAAMYAVAGMMFEVFFTGFLGGVKRNFRGGVSLLMGILYVIVYFSAPFLIRLLNRTGLKNVFGRAVPLTVTIYLFEYAFGLCCQAAGFNAWRYTQDKYWESILSFFDAAGSSWADIGFFSVWSNGNITLDMLPVWFGYAIFIEQVLKIIHRTSDYLAGQEVTTWKGFWSLVGKDEF